MSKHSTGPWKKTPITGGGYYIENDNEIIAAVRGDPGETQDANAAMIAAAPELLDACKLALEIATSYLKDPNLKWTIGLAMSEREDE